MTKKMKVAKRNLDLNLIPDGQVAVLYGRIITLEQFFKGMDYEDAAAYYETCDDLYKPEYEINKK